MFPQATFTKLLGTSSARTFAPQDANWHRWAVLNVWPTTSAAENSGELVVIKKWQAIARANAALWLSPLSVKGSWGGHNPFALADSQDLNLNAKGQISHQKWLGPTVALTRARIRPSKWLDFWRSSPPVAHELRNSPGLIGAMGIGEAPIGLQGTLSIWQSNQALTGFVQRGLSHLKAIKSAQNRGWYSEDLFARFALVAASGSITNIDFSSLRLPSTP